MNEIREHTKLQLLPPTPNPFPFSSPQAMRNKYVAPGVSIYYYVVEWESAKLSWDDFRGSVLGPTDPATGPDGCLRGVIYKQWKVCAGLRFCFCVVWFVIEDDETVQQKKTQPAFPSIF